MHFHKRLTLFMILTPALLLGYKPQAYTNHISVCNSFKMQKMS